MGNFITKSAHISLLQLIKSSLASADNHALFKTEIVKAALCLKDQKNNLQGTSWLVPLMLHREPQVTNHLRIYRLIFVNLLFICKIRSISFCLMSLLINVSFARQKLLVDQTGIWSIAFNILLDHTESSIVRTQACSLLINLTQFISSSHRLDQDEVN
jgi:hypothetical protein